MVLRRKSRVTDLEVQGNEILTVGVKLFAIWVLKVLVLSAASLFFVVHDKFSYERIFCSLEI